MSQRRLYFSFWSAKLGEIDNWMYENWRWWPISSPTFWELCHFGLPQLCILKTFFCQQIGNSNSQRMWKRKKNICCIYQEIKKSSCISNHALIHWYMQCCWYGQFRLHCDSISWHIPQNMAWKWCTSMQCVLHMLDQVRKQ